MESKTVSKEVIPGIIDPNISVGEVVMLSEGYDNAVKVIVNSHRNFAANVTEVKSGIKWTVSASLLTKITN